MNYNYNKDYYVKNKEKILLKNKEYRINTNYDHIHNNFTIQCEICKKILNKKSLRYHYKNNICKKYIEYTTSPYNIIYQN